MARPRRAKTLYKLVRRGDRNNWYIQWTEERNGEFFTKYASTGTEDKTEAERQLARFIDEIERPSDELTVDEVIERYRKYKISKNNAINAEPRNNLDLNRLTYFKEFMGSLFMSQVTINPRII